MKWLSKSLVVLFVAFSTSCVMYEAETPKQKFYAAESLYAIVAEQAADYVSSPWAKPEIVAKIQAIDAKAYTAVKAGRAAIFTLDGDDQAAKIDLAVKGLGFARSDLEKILAKENEQ